MSEPDGVTLRAATSADVAGIARLDDLPVAARRTVGDDLGRTALRHAVVATADTDGAIVGFAMATRQADAAHVLDLVVDRAWRRRGLATALVAWLAAAAAGDGTPALTLEVRAGNGAARALYAALGFDDAGVRPGYYPDGEDAHVLWHHDPTALAHLPADPPDARNPSR